MGAWPTHQLTLDLHHRWLTLDLHYVLHLAYNRAYIWPAIWLTPGLYYDFTLVTYTTAYTLGPELDEMHIDATPPACSTWPSTAPHGRAHRLPLLLAAPCKLDCSVRASTKVS